MITYNPALTTNEMISLAFSDRPEIQSLVAQARATLKIVEQHGISDTEARMVSAIVHTAATKGRLHYTRRSTRFCPCCGAGGGYYAVKRTTQWKRKGDPDTDKPKMVMGTDVSDSFIVTRGYISLGYCDECSTRIAPALRAELQSAQAAIPEQITGEPPRFIWRQNMTCTRCSWSGHEGEMKMLTAIMGGKYPSGCPNCDAKNLPFGPRLIKLRDGFFLEAT